MGARILFSSLIVLIFAAATNLPRKVEAAPTAEELLDEINRLPEPERQARLVSGAKKEGSIVWYVAMNRPNVLDLARAFEAEHPFLKVRALTGRGLELVNRIITEHRAKNFLYDVLITRSLVLNYLRREGVIMHYLTPHRKFLRDGFFDQEGYFNGLYSRPQVFVFNTKLVSQKDAPKSIEDLLHPKWKGKLAMDKLAYDWLAVLLDYYGEKKGRETATRLGQQGLQIRSGPTLLLQLVAAGEFPLVIDGYLHEAMMLKKAGAPIDYIFPSPFVPAITPPNAYASSRPPHPYAMALFIDFLLSKKGQEVMKGHGRWVAHKEISSADLGERAILVPFPAKWGDREKELAMIFDQLILNIDQR
jgi:iron(III) transport system substrate-binding protein